MAARSVTVAALQHRPRQAVLVVVLSAVVTAAAVLGPLYARSVEQSVLRNVVAEASPTQRTLVVADASDEPAAPRQLARTVRGAIPPQFGTPVGGAETPVQLATPGGDGVQARLTSRDGLCAHLTVTAGRCVRAAGEVLVSRRSAAITGLEPGASVTMTAGNPDAGGVRSRATVVGLYESIDVTTPYWAGRAQPPAAPEAAVGEQSALTIDEVFTTWPTLAAEPWPGLRTHLDIGLRPDRLDLDRMAEVQAATAEVDALAATVGAAASSKIGPLLDSTTVQRDQARSVIPLLAVQLAVLGIVVLAFVCAAATEQRRPEIALARLRGHGTFGAALLLLRELGVLVLAGTVLGAALGWLVAIGAAALWLQPGVGVEIRWAVGAAALASLVAGLLAIIAAGTPTLRQPLTSLLRRVPPRASTLQVGLVEGAVVAAAAAGVATLLTGDGGPIALLAPGLLAIAGGLLLAQATIPTAGPLARLALRRGRVSWALAGLQIARRPALRRLIAIVTVACALLVFAVDAWSVADRNRTTRAELEAGAPVVLTVDADSSLALRQAVLDIDPDGTFATPVVTVSSLTEVGPRTTAVEPAAFARIARWGDDDRRPASKALTSITPTLPAPIEITGDRVEVEATFASRGLSRELDGPDPELGGPLRLSLGISDRAGVGRQVDIGRLREGRGTYRADIDCEQGCHLEQVVVNRTFGDFVDAQVSLDVLRLRAGTAGALADVDLDNETVGSWDALPWRPDAFTDSFVDAGDTLALSGVSFGVPVAAQRGTRPVMPAALVAGDLPPLPADPSQPDTRVLAQDLATDDVAYEVVGRLPQIPRSGTKGVLVDLASLVTGPSGSPAQTSYDVWLAADDPDREQALRRDLADHGLHVVSRDTTGAHATAFASEGPTLALRLALLAGLVAVVLAAAVLVVGVATSGASRARDLAGLRIVGVPASTVRTASVREHLVVAVLGVLAGGVLGLAAAQAALPDVPLFAVAAVKLPVVLDPAWEAVALTIGACLVVLCAVSVVVGRALAAAAVPARLREGR